VNILCNGKKYQRKKFCRSKKKKSELNFNHVAKARVKQVWLTHPAFFFVSHREEEEEE
jgi:hypothetical protein